MPIFTKLGHKSSAEAKSSGQSATKAASRSAGSPLKLGQAVPKGGVAMKLALDNGRWQVIWW